MAFVFRAALAVLLLLGVYVLAALLVGVVAFGVYEAAVHGLAGYLLGKGFILVLILVVGLGRAFWAVRRLPSGEPRGYALTADTQPRLWDEVRAIAEVVGTRPPDAVLLTPEVNASVWERSRLLGLVGGRRVLSLGAPLVMGLSAQQLRAVLAHELGHYSHRHTALSSVAYRGQVTIGHIVDQLGHDNLTGKLFDWYGRLYLRVTTSVTRRQEVEADQWSQRVAGRVASAGAMRELPALGAIWEFFLESYAFPVEGVRPQALFEGFRNVLASPQRQADLDPLRTELPEPRQDPYDTHPSLRSRIEFFEGLPDDGIEDDASPALGLLRDVDATFLAFEAELFADTELETQSWEWLAATAGQRRSREGAAMLVQAADQPHTGARTLSEAIKALARGDARSLVHAYVAPDTRPDQVDGLARALVTRAVSAALVEHCGARFAVNWDRTDSLVDADGRPVDAAGLVATAADRDSATWLIGLLRDEGVPPWFSVDPSTVESLQQPEPEPQVQAVAVCIHWRRMRALAVTDHGLVVKRMGMVETVAAGFRHGSLDGYRSAMLLVASVPLPELVKDRRARVYPWEQVESVTVRRKHLEMRLAGKYRRMKVVRHAVAGDLVGALADHLGPRLVVPRS